MPILRCLKNYVYNMQQCVQLHVKYLHVHRIQHLIQRNKARHNGLPCTLIQNITFNVTLFYYYRIPSFIKKCNAMAKKFKLFLNFKIVRDLNCQMKIHPTSCGYNLPSWLEDTIYLCVNSRSPNHIHFSIGNLKEGSKITQMQRQVSVHKPSKQPFMN